LNHEKELAKAFFVDFTDDALYNIGVGSLWSGPWKLSSLIFVVSELRITSLFFSNHKPNSQWGYITILNVW